jgi:hypothetical protein
MPSCLNLVNTTGRQGNLEERDWTRDTRLLYLHYLLLVCTRSRIQRVIEISDGACVNVSNRDPAECLDLSQDRSRAEFHEDAESPEELPVLRCWFWEICKIEVWATAPEIRGW